MRVFCVAFALAICGAFLWGWAGTWDKAVQAYHDLDGVIVGLMVLAILAAPVVAFIAHFDGGGERGVVGRADGDDSCD